MLRLAMQLHMHRRTSLVEVWPPGLPASQSQLGTLFLVPASSDRPVTRTHPLPAG